MADVVDELDPSDFLSEEELAALQAEAAAEAGGADDVTDEIDLSEFMTPEELAKIQAMEGEGEGAGEPSDEVDEIDLSEFLSPEELAALEDEELERQARAEIEADAALLAGDVVDELDPSDFLSAEELVALEDAELEAQAMRDLGYDANMLKNADKDKGAGKSEGVSEDDIAAMRDLGMSEAEIKAYIAAQNKPEDSASASGSAGGVSEEDIAAMRDLGMSEAEIKAYVNAQGKPEASASAKKGSASGANEEDIVAMRDLGMSEAEISAYVAAQNKPAASSGSSEIGSTGGVSEEDIAAMRDLGMSEAEISAFFAAQSKPKGAPPRGASSGSAGGVSEDDIAAMRDLGMSEADIAKFVEAQKPKEKKRPGAPPQVNKDGTVDFRAMMKRRPGGAPGDDKGAGDDKPAFGLGMLKKRGGGGPAGGDGKPGEEGGTSFGLGMLKATGKRPMADTSREEQEALPGGFGVSLKKSPLDDKLKAKLGGEETPAANTSGSLFDWGALGLGDWKPPDDFENSYLLELKEQKEEMAAADGGDKKSTDKKSADKKGAAKPPAPGGPPPPPPKAPTAADLERVGKGAPGAGGPPPPPPPPPSNEQLAARGAGAPEPPAPPGGGSALDALMAKRAQGGVPPPPPAPPVPLNAGGPPPPPPTPPVPLSAGVPPPPPAPPVPLASGPPPPPKAPPVPLAAPPPPATAPVPLTTAAPPPPKAAPVPLAAPPPPATAPVPLAAPPPPKAAPVPLAPAAAPPPPATAPAPFAPLPELAPLPPPPRELTEEERDALAEQEWAALEAKSLAYAREKRRKAEEEERAAKIARGEDPDKKPESESEEEEAAQEEEEKAKEAAAKAEEEKKSYHGARARSSSGGASSASVVRAEEDGGDAEEELEASLAAWSSAQHAQQSDASAFAPGMLALLELGEPSLNELLEQNDVLLLVRYRLDDYADVARVLTSSDALYDLVDYLTEPLPAPEREADEAEAAQLRRLRYPAMACELLASKVPALDDVLLDDGVLVQRLLAFFRAPRHELSLLLAPGVARVLASLLEYRAAALLPHLQDASPPWLPALLVHVHVDAVWSVITALARCEGGEAWLVQEQLPKQLLAFVTVAEENASDHAARADSRAVVHVVRELLLVCVADGPLVTALCAEAVAVLPALACAAPPLSVYAARDALDVLRALVAALGVHAERAAGAVAWPVAPLDAVPALLSALLTSDQLDALGDVLSAPSEHDLTDATGKLHAVFGVQRHAALQLLHALVALKWPAVLEAVVVSGSAALLAAVNTFLDYEQCNMAHELVAGIFVQLLTHAPSELLGALVEDTHLVDKLVEAQRLWNAERGLERHPPPYLPYLHLIGHRLVASAAFHAELTAHCESHAEWGMLKDELSKLRETQRRLELEEISPLPPGYPPEPKHEGFTSGDEDAPAPRTAASAMPTTPRVSLQPEAADETLAADAAALLDSVEGDAALEALMGDDLDYMLQGVTGDDALLDAMLAEPIDAPVSATPRPGARDAIDSILNGGMDAHVQGTDLTTISLDDILNGM